MELRVALGAVQELRAEKYEKVEPAQLNHYTSKSVAKALCEAGSHSVGTTRSNRLGFPHSLKNMEHFQCQGERGELQYVCDDSVVYIHGWTC